MNNQEQKTILLVEDEVNIALAQAAMIQRFGYQVLTVYSGEKAVETVISHEKINLILMDIDLGRGIDGPEAARQILEKKNLPIVFLTSYAEKEYVEKVKEITCYGYVLKGSGDFVLRSSIEMAYELFEAKEDLREKVDGLRVHQIELEMQAEELRQAQLESESSRARYFDLYDLAPVGYCTVGQEGLILEANLTAAALLGEDRRALVRKPLSRFILSEDQDLYYRYSKLIKAHSAGSGQTGVLPAIELRMKKTDGIPFWVRLEATASQNPDGLPVLRVVLSDITERKQSEEEIRLLNTELEQRVRERTAELVAINEELEGLNYSIAHDLRAPLRHLDGFVGLLNHHLPKGLDEKSQHYLKVISDSAVKMGRLIDDVLSFSSLGRVEMNRTRFNMETLLNEVLKMIQPELQDREIVWSIGPLPEVYGDPTLLKTVLTNLISNAVKFTNRNPQAVIEIGHSSDQAQEEVFYVKDNGAGFDMQYRHKLFNLFQRLHHEPDFEGTGLGLANIQRIIKRHGGRVWAEGAVDQGATFYFSLPKKGSKAGSE